jgi:hypothetical protein
MEDSELAQHLERLLAQDQDDLQKFRAKEISLEDINRNIRERTEQVREILRQAFPTKRLVGEKAYEAFIALILHSDDPELMTLVATAIFSLGIEDADRAHAAYIVDKLLVREGKPQRYGTQFSLINKKDSVVFLPVEEPEKLDARRAEIGLPPLSEYEEQIRKSQH